MDASQKVVVCVTGAGGLGNTLFQLAAALHYVEKYSYALVIKRCLCTTFGTAIGSDRSQALQDENKTNISYEHSIFKKLVFVDELPPDAVVWRNDYSDQYLTLDKANLKSIILSGYQQHRAMVVPQMQLLLKSLSFGDMVEKLVQKYAPTKDPAFFASCVCVGLRRGADFAHMQKITDAAYRKVLETYFLKHTVLIISDLKVIPFATLLTQPSIIINEPDVVQFAMCFLCPNIILSESTFHLWLGYLTDFTFKDKSTVVCFNDTDLTRRNLDLKHWIHVDV